MSERRPPAPDFAAIDALYRSALQGDSAALSELASICKTKAARAYVADKPNRGQLRALLTSEAPKTRKNTARLLGALGEAGDGPALADALKGETTLYVIPSIILAIGACAPHASNDDRNRALTTIRDARIQADELSAPSDLSHRDAIRQACSGALSALEPQNTRLAAPLPPQNIHLRAPEGCGDILLSEAIAIGLRPQKRHDRALLYRDTHLSALYALRCFEEALVPIAPLPLPPANAHKAELLTWAQSAALALKPFEALLTAHYDPAPVPYRIELRGLSHESRTACVHALALRLDEAGTLRNSPSAYVAELRLEADDIRLRAYAKITQPPDPRYAYRSKALPASIHPTVAANLLRFAKPHLKSNARVLDPCCGAGTLLVERALLEVPVKECVGVDIAPAAITAARTNAKAAIRLHPELSGKLSVIGGDLRRFAAISAFDELIANLPFGVRVGSSDANDALYRSLFQQLNTWMAPDGTVILYTTQRPAVARLASQYGWTFADETRFEAGGLKPWGIVLRRRGR